MLASRQSWKTGYGEVPVFRCGKYVHRLIALLVVTSTLGADATLGQEVGVSPVIAETYGETWLLELLISGLVTWGIGLVPPLIIRFALLKRPLNKWPAIGTCAAFWFLNVVFFTALGSQSKTHGALTVVAFVSYWILRKPARGKTLMTSVTSRAQTTLPISERWLAFGLAVMFSVGVLWFGYAHFSQPDAVSRYSDLSIGDPMQQVLYTKGNPSYVLVSALKESDGSWLAVLLAADSLPVDRHVSDYPSWSYSLPNGGTLTVDFSSNSKCVVRVACVDGSRVDCPALLGISVGTLEDEIIDKFGTASSAEFSDERDVTKTVRYPAHNVAFILRKREVHGFMVENAGTAPPNHPDFWPRD